MFKNASYIYLNDFLKVFEHVNKLAVWVRQKFEFSEPVTELECISELHSFLMADKSLLPEMVASSIYLKPDIIKLIANKVIIKKPSTDSQKSSKPSLNKKSTKEHYFKISLTKQNVFNDIEEYVLNCPFILKIDKEDIDIINRYKMDKF